MLRERIQGAAVELSWIPALQKDTRARNGHASTAIEGNPLTLEQVRLLEEGREVSAVAARPQREVLNYFAGLSYVEKHAKEADPRWTSSTPRLLAAPVMDQGQAGRYRTIPVRVGAHPARRRNGSGLMAELLDWWNGHVGGAFAGPELRHPPLPVRGDPSLRRRQRPDRPSAGAVGALSARLRQSPHLLGRRVLLGGSPRLLRGTRRGPTGRVGT